MIRNETISDQIITIDNAEFDNCHFVNCTLEYSGGPATLTNSKMTDCSYIFLGCAGRTIAFLQSVNLLSNHPGWTLIPNRPN
jgi:hypothetical protein